MPVAPHINPLIAAISDDHQNMCEYYDQYFRSTGDADAQGRWARQFIWLVAQHIVGEELVVYPLMEKYLEVSGRTYADQDRTVHQKVKILLHSIESPNANQADILKSVMEELRPHNDNEVKRDLPLLTGEIGEAASVRAAASFKWTKKFFGPTRTHPGAPSKPPFETVAALLEAPIDWLKDLFANFPKDSELSRNPLINAIADDRWELYSYYDQYMNSNGDVDAQDSWARQLIWDVARHIVGVELVVHPLMVRYLGAIPGQELAHEGHVVHQKIRQLLYNIESHKPDSPEHVEILRSVFMEHLRPRIDIEVKGDFPLLVKAITRAASAQAAASLAHLHNDDEVRRELPLHTKAIAEAAAAEAVARFERTKNFAPTHAHPDAHDNLPFETPTALMQAPIDQLQAIFENFPA